MLAWILIEAVTVKNKNKKDSGGYAVVDSDCEELLNIFFLFSSFLYFHIKY